MTTDLATVLQARLTARAKLMTRARDILIGIRDDLDDEGDRVYFGSTNHAELFKDLTEEFDGWVWDDIIDDGKKPDLIGDNCALRAEVERLRGELADEKMEHNELTELLSRPEIDDFQDGLVLEAAHQRQRWGDAHDRSKSAENWYWLVGYLASKALRASIEGNQNKARHHTISTAAALFQWHKAIGASPNGVGADADLAPVEQPIRKLEDVLDEAEADLQKDHSDLSTDTGEQTT